MIGKINRRHWIQQFIVQVLSVPLGLHSLCKSFWDRHQRSVLTISILLNQFLLELKVLYNWSEIFFQKLIISSNFPRIFKIEIMFDIWIIH